MSRSTPQDHIGGRSELGAASPASYAVCQNSMPCDALMRVKRAAIRGYTYVQGTHAGFGSRTNAMKFTMQADATIIPQAHDRTVSLGLGLVLPAVHNDSGAEARNKENHSNA